MRRKYKTFARYYKVNLKVMIHLSYCQVNQAASVYRELDKVRLSEPLLCCWFPFVFVVVTYELLEIPDAGLVPLFKQYVMFELAGREGFKHNFEDWADDVDEFVDGCIISNEFGLWFGGWLRFLWGFDNAFAKDEPKNEFRYFDFCIFSGSKSNPQSSSKEV